MTKRLIGIKILKGVTLFFIFFRTSFFGVESMKIKQKLSCFVFLLFFIGSIACEEGDPTGKKARSSSGPEEDGCTPIDVPTAGDLAFGLSGV